MKKHHIVPEFWPMWETKHNSPIHLVTEEHHGVGRPTAQVRFSGHDEVVCRTNKNAEMTRKVMPTQERKSPS